MVPYAPAPSGFPLLVPGTDSGGEQASAITPQLEGYAPLPHLMGPQVQIWFQPFDHFGEHGSPHAERKAFKADRGSPFIMEEVLKTFPGYDFYGDFEGKIKRIPSVLSGTFIEVMMADQYYSGQNRQWYFREPTIRLYKRRAPPLFEAARWTILLGLLVAAFFCIDVWMAIQISEKPTAVRVTCGFIANMILTQLAPDVAFVPWALSAWKVWVFVKLYANPRNWVVLLSGRSAQHGVVM